MYAYMHTYVCKHRVRRLFEGNDDPSKRFHVLQIPLQTCLGHLDKRRPSVRRDSNLFARCVMHHNYDMRILCRHVCMCATFLKVASFIIFLRSETTMAAA